jgi:cell filamentation protein
MKQRVLVMNGQRLLQGEHEGAWQTEKVEKAGSLKPGIYNLYAANQADKGKVHQGVVVHADAKHVYQKSGGSITRHNRGDFDKVPELGMEQAISYDGPKAVVSNATTQGRRLTQ